LQNASGAIDAMQQRRGMRDEQTTEMNRMRDTRKFNILIIAVVMLTALVILQNVAKEYFMADIEGYVKRRLYYERTISQKGLSEQKGMYWREKE